MLAGGRIQGAFNCFCFEWAGTGGGGELEATDVHARLLEACS